MVLSPSVVHSDSWSLLRLVNGGYLYRLRSGCHCIGRIKWTLISTYPSPPQRPLCHAEKIILRKIAKNHIFSAPYGLKEKKKAWGQREIRKCAYIYVYTNTHPCLCMLTLTCKHRWKPKIYHFIRKYIVQKILNKKSRHLFREPIIINGSLLGNLNTKHTKQCFSFRGGRMHRMNPTPASCAADKCIWWLLRSQHGFHTLELCKGTLKHLKGIIKKEWFLLPGAKEQ